MPQHRSLPILVHVLIQHIIYVSTSVHLTATLTADMVPHASIGASVACHRNTPYRLGFYHSTAPGVFSFEFFMMSVTAPAYLEHFSIQVELYFSVEVATMLQREWSWFPLPGGRLVLPVFLKCSIHPP
jgi:hypothetical protein